ncbi:hypothetical protein GLIP_1119 [Aliiglaciecola lipolytica E3]|uniref:Uncharacterized protein n=1 Tax=Aliiglaciecola lipolytica E3 TaxID=1127673 RepID=K6YR24_9ALTE|nr:hypothetical protein GLIP_1119 [Aliiglaciecola lipolytica E3]
MHLSGIACCATAEKPMHKAIAKINNRTNFKVARATLE